MDWPTVPFLNNKNTQLRVFRLYAKLAEVVQRVCRLDVLDWNCLVHRKIIS